MKIVVDSGEFVEAQCPVIVSASRSTDIPAWYARWFVNRLRKGYAVWYNPFNQRPVYISFRNTRVVVFWTKDPAPIIPYLPELDKAGINYYFQFTLNDYEQEGLELNLPTLENRIDTFKTLSGLIGREKVIWRFDPLIITPSSPARELLTRIWEIGNRLRSYTDKLVISFVDIKQYKKVYNNLVRDTHYYDNSNIDKAEPSNDQINELAKGLAAIRDRWHNEGWDIDIATCAEEVDLGEYGILHNKCIDDALMKRIFWQDEELMYFLSTGKVFDKSSLFSDEVVSSKTANLKDKGQRKVCGCIVSKDIGMYNTCKHNCLYCYANTSKSIVDRNMILHSDDNESII